MNRLLSTILLVTVALSVGPVAEAGAGSCAEADLRQNFIMVRVAPGQTLQDFIDALEADYDGLTATLFDSIPDRPLHLLVLGLPPDWNEADLDQFELALPLDYGTLIVWGEFLYTDEAPEGGTGSTFVSSIGGQELFDSQYATQTIDSGGAQQRSTGVGVVVAVLDTGIDVSHPRLAGRIAPGGADLVENDGDPSDVGDDVDNDGDLLVDEMTGHGTYVAGLVHLVAPDSLLLPVRVLDTEGHGDLWILAKGIYYAIDRGVEVINISVSSTYKSDAVEEAVEAAKNLGIVVVAAAGNCDRSEPEEHPASTSNALGVAATDDQDVKGAFSNFGPKLFISAPGASVGLQGKPDPERSIISTIPGGDYAYWEGTSMAAPLTAGTTALIRSQHPQWPASDFAHDAIELRLESSAVDIDSINQPYAGELGVGRLNAAGAVNLGPVAPTLGDLDGSGAVGTADLLILLSDWGLTHTSADLNGDGTVSTADLLLLLSVWGQ
jgi:subtilisin family serine protease